MGRFRMGRFRMIHCIPGPMPIVPKTDHAAYDERNPESTGHQHLSNEFQLLSIAAFHVAP